MLLRTHFIFLSFGQPVLYVRGLRSLNLGDNEVKSLPDEIGNLTALEELILSKNGEQTG